MDILTKKIVLVGSCLVATIILVVDYLGTVFICSGESGCVTTIATMGVIFLPALPLAVISILVYFLRDEIFQSWIRFTLWWIPLSMLFTLVFQDQHGQLISSTKQMVSFFMAVLFTAISLTLIIYKSRQLRQKV